MKVLVTRPGEAGQTLVKQLQQRGIEAVYFPTLIIESISPPQPLDEFTQAELVIFISPSAVKHGAQYFNALGKQQFMAVGVGTAAALQKQGFTNVAVPDDFTSEGLLAMQALQQVSDKLITIVKGIGGRELLRDSLLAKGARVMELVVYQRLQPNEVLSQAVLAKVDIILATSVMSVEHLIAMTPKPLQAELWSKVWLVASARIEQFVSGQAKGIETILADNVCNETLICLLESLAKSP